MSNTHNLPERRGWAIAAIVFIAASLALAFAWSAGWIGTRLTSKAFVNSATDFPPGFRRAHGKGMCYAATFRPTEAARSFSTARAFSQPEVPVTGRFSIGTGSPFSADASTKTVSMAVLMSTDDQQQWRMAMNNQPYFATRNAEGFLALQKATALDPATGKPDPERIAGFFKQYPEARKFLERARQAPSPGSFAGATFYGINAFYLVSAQGQRVPVRWFMQAREPFTTLTEEQRKTVSPDFLFEDLQRKLADTPLYWDLILQVAQPGDPVDDPSQPWPDDRQQIVAGSLQVTRVSEQTSGACRDINFDPTILPTGIEVSNDPILNARSAAYSHSFNKREREIGYGQATDAVGKQVTP